MFPDETLVYNRETRLWAAKAGEFPEENFKYTPPTPATPVEDETVATTTTTTASGAHMHISSPIISTSSITSVGSYLTATTSSVPRVSITIDEYNSRIERAKIDGRNEALAPIVAGLKSPGDVISMLNLSGEVLLVGDDFPNKESVLLDRETLLEVLIYINSNPQLLVKEALKTEKAETKTSIFSGLSAGWYQDAKANLYNFDGTKWDSLNEDDFKKLSKELEFLG